ncbi:MAG TPA: ATP-binding protein [Thermosulfurimonas dismutans]|uniref:ATP-binding protein n=1 Tax=Thermosulfurimonas dismutans TaxID=999894 RepID=A0A7C3CK86_9BACT|nr:ATP-binding protein [Thermosulfurimonas dismutans]
MALKKRFFKEPSGSFFLFGPRGTGKSTWLRQNIRADLYLDLLDPETYRELAAHPEFLLYQAEALPSGATVVIDEIQKLPSLLDVVHLLIEKKGLRFILSGSSARKLKRAGVDLLAGRATVYYLHPFMAGELAEEFSLERALSLGMIPLVLASSSPEETLRSYVSLYIKEEVQAEALVRNIGAFGRFLEVMTFSHASVLNLSEIAREAQVKRKTVEGYLSVLEDLLLAFRVPVFTRRAKRHLTAHPKFYFFDPGVFRILRPKGPLDRSSEIEGQALEGLVAQHLRAWMDYSRIQADLFFWRTRAGNEVDFVLYGPDLFVALEVKNSTVVHSGMLRGLLAFKEDYPEAQVLLLYRGRHALRVKDIPCLPVEEFLRSLRPGEALISSLGKG